MRTLSKDEARRIGSELKRWSERPVGAANARALGLCAVLVALMLVSAQQLPVPAVRRLAAISAVMLASLHYISLAILRGLLRAGVAEARDAMDAVRDPRRISAFDMAMAWLLVAALARYWE